MNSETRLDKAPPKPPKGSNASESFLELVKVENLQNLFKPSESRWLEPSISETNEGYVPPKPPKGFELRQESASVSFGGGIGRLIQKLAGAECLVCGCLIPASDLYCAVCLELQRNRPRDFDERRRRTAARLAGQKCECGASAWNVNFRGDSWCSACLPGGAE